MVNSDWPAWVDLLFRGLAAIGGVVGLIGGLVMALAHRTFATKDEVEQSFKDHQGTHKELEKQLADGAKEFATIRADLSHLPDQGDIAEVKDRIAALEGTVSAAVATIEGMREGLKRIERPLNLLLEHHLKVPS
jgi:septal ring factor EnvC (AmiA/AmiB activator)